MGTYSDEDPNASIPQKVVNSIKKITGLDKDPSRKEPVNPDTHRTPQEEADYASGNSSGISSNTGASGQSTDAYNKY
jgi:hypothetical protein